MPDICNYVPPRKIRNDLEFTHFVYETNLKRHHQPFCHAQYYMNLVFKGDGVLKVNGKEFDIKSGDLFFTFPNQCYTILGSDDFTFLYISFNGNNASELMKSVNINDDNFLFPNQESLCKFWMDSIIRVRPNNSNFITESVFMYTLSFIENYEDEQHEQTKSKFDTIIEYIGYNYATNDMSIKKVAHIFFYNEKYLSALFVKNTGVKFSQYINNLRIRYATELISKGKTDIAEISYKCGYTDQFYFSKVFKKITGHTPSQYIKILGPKKK